MCFKVVILFVWAIWALFRLMFRAEGVATAEEAKKAR